MRDIRNPEFLGSALEKLKQLFPDLSATERADLLEDQFSLQTLVSPNRNGHDKPSAAG